MAEEPMKIFLLSYNHEGARWGIRIHARDHADAQARVAKLVYATVDGELMMEISGAFGPVAPFIVRVRNWFWRRRNA